MLRGRRGRKIEDGRSVKRTGRGESSERKRERDIQIRWGWLELEDPWSKKKVKMKLPIEENVTVQREQRYLDLRDSGKKCLKKIKDIQLEEEGKIQWSWCTRREED